ncbi:hypothetical protein ACI3LY_003492 [Candidozyma auris]|uniref:Uncharacterized protein n=2 Tax=Candidozyma auris TaxID=498019 RepID=A0A2H0ZWA3_CANAR|nr:hypothetical_protein [[Candida] auris]KNE02454.2 hypothetical protein QG37_00257 [[Candida] auris]PIS52578.1 hypothetical protein CJI97_002226 [[Candida] auris]PIS54888.1 hypothetical protein B9J08_002035 [[Candida] auris]PSK77997.1 hypothetical protein CJJ07_002146 [[Candida] auris]QEL60988.1 hypothetical protein CJJ09_003122 [[Candida] auris]
MYTYILQWIANRFLKENQLNRLGVEDPYYEEIPVNTNEKTGKTTYKRVKRQIPKGLSQNDINVLQTVRKRAYRYDMWFSVLGFKLGWSNVVGVVPVFGAIVANYWSLSIYWQARSLDDGLPLDIQLLFFFNIAIDFVLSFIPIVGQLIEIGYKANSRNFLLLEKHLERVGQKNLGLISEDEVRPGFINDKVQPFVDENLKPGAIRAGESALKAGESLKHLVQQNLHSAGSSSQASSTNTAEPTIQGSEATATATLDSFTDDDAKSVRSLRATKQKRKS